MPRDALEVARAELRRLIEQMTTDDLLPDDFGDRFIAAVECLIAVKTGASGFYRARVTVVEKP